VGRQQINLTSLGSLAGPAPKLMMCGFRVVIVGRSNPGNGQKLVANPGS